MKLVVVIPTYKEVENVKRIIPATLEAFAKLPHHECHILVVDGNSPDGTGEAVTELAQTYPNVHLLMEKEKSGLGGAYIYAFKYAMENLHPDVIIEMDADFQHNPNDIPRLMEKIDQGYDYIIGSRFTKGGSIPKEWGLTRKFWSVGGNIFSKLVLGVRNVSDFTSGFKAARVGNYLDRIDLSTIRSKGFAYKIELLYKMDKLNAKIAEVPIEFGIRDRGNSKMEGNNALDSLKVVLSIKINENKSLVKFLFVGVAGFITDVTLFNIFRVTLFDSTLSAVISGLIAMIVTFTLNNIWSFGEQKISGIFKLLGTFIVYGVSSAIPILFRSQLVDLFVKALGDKAVIANIGFLIGVAFGLVWNYLVYSKIIWRKKVRKGQHD